MISIYRQLLIACALLGVVVADAHAELPTQLIDTQARCEAIGGRWGGEVTGRGRSPGCNLPTKDAGRKCSDSSQCETGCIARDSSNQNCSCYEWTMYPKGEALRYCSFKGIVYGPHVD